MTAIAINGITLVVVLWSLAKDRERTKKAFRNALKRGLSLAPMMIFILLIIGLLLAFFPPSLIEHYLGGDLNMWQVILATVIGSIVMVPSLIAFPLAGSLIDSGASYTPIAAFITTLTMVGFVSLPLEIKEMGKRLTAWRNLLALVSAVVIALIMGAVLK